MKIFLGILLSCGTFGWTPGEADRAAVDRSDAASAVTPSSQPAATAPAENGVRPVAGLRRRIADGPRRRDFGPPGGPGPRWGERMRPGPPPGPPGPPSPQDVDELIQFARENFPQIHERLERLRRMNPPGFQRMLPKVYGRLKPIMDLRQTDPPAAQKAIEEQRLQMIIMDLSDRYRRARSDEQRSRLKGEIEARLRERFDRHQERMRLEIDHLRRRLDKQERELAERERNKDELLHEDFEQTVSNPPLGPRPEPE